MMNQRLQKTEKPGLLDSREVAHKEYAPAGIHETRKSHNTSPILSTSDLDLRSPQMKGEETGNPLQKGVDHPGVN